MTGLAGFVVELRTDLPPDETLRRLLDLRAHDRIIPLTHVSPALSADELTPGTLFVARTALGPLGFDDPMRIESLTFAPAAATIHKLGRAIAGDIDITVTPTDGGAVVRWEQSTKLPWLPARLQSLAARILRCGYRRVLRRLLAG
ncbi:hypothetical protein [Tessaracoccus defluvii]|uniref:SRPBCC family protein n=1 Tax=Tessaracoccus defluvii TaxID=1285901 RepID=A0A7H0H4J0_9ACTN|nr:hypothetical protein [Tessaracoccus defluvii]QNP55456.1 hypothetical protein H9L22_14830 [Tessaracoccus defluvii]